MYYALCNNSRGQSEYRAHKKETISMTVMNEGLVDEFYLWAQYSNTLSLISATMMSWVRVWVDLDLFTT